LDEPPEDEFELELEELFEDEFELELDELLELELEELLELELEELFEDEFELELDELLELELPATRVQSTLSVIAGFVTLSRSAPVGAGAACAAAAAAAVARVASAVMVTLRFMERNSWFVGCAGMTTAPTTTRLLPFSSLWGNLRHVASSPWRRPVRPHAHHGARPHRIGHDRRGCRPPRCPASAAATYRFGPIRSKGEADVGGEALARTSLPKPSKVRCAA
jgi:hypothetical protein